MVYTLRNLWAATAMLMVSHADAQAVPPVQPEIGVSAFPFDISQVSLGGSRWLENQGRTLTYLKWVDVNRLLYNFRKNHGLSTAGAAALGGWEAPDFPFRTHVQGHFLTAWAQCYVTVGDSICRDKATTFVDGLAKSQANNAAVGFTKGYLSGFPESEFTALEGGTLRNGNVPYYAIHKTMAGLLDVWRHLGNTQARDVLLSLAGWVETRNSRLSTTQMQNLMRTEFGGMNDVLAEIYQQTGNKKWLTAAQRFDHNAVFDPLAANQDQLSGLHANTQVPKWIGAAREYKATGNARYLDIARNAWNITVKAHTYAIGGNSRAEHFGKPNAIGGELAKDTCEACNSYNMLKLTRELWGIDPNPAYFDFYENALLNHLLGQQHPKNAHGHVTYFTPLNPGGRRGVGPAWGGGTWSTDSSSFWCCQGTGVETNTKYADSIYFYNDNTLYVNLFTPSTLQWKKRGVAVVQSTTFPVSDTSTLKVTGSGDWTMSIRIPAWTSNAEISINGQAAQQFSSGTYAKLTRTWKSGDTITVRLPMAVRTIAANDDQTVRAIAYGPVILAGNYGDSSLASMPSLSLSSVRRTSGLAFTATADRKQVNLGPFYDAHDFNYNVYWKIST